MSENSKMIARPLWLVITDDAADIVCLQNKFNSRLEVTHYLTGQYFIRGMNLKDCQNLATHMKNFEK